MLKISRCDLTEAELEGVRRVMFDNQYLGMAVEVRQFEEEIRATLDAPEAFVTCVNTGTSALHLAVQACGIGHGDDVLIPTITYVASFQAVSATGAKPIACEINPSTMQIDLNDAAQRVNANTKAIMPVHYAGHPGDLEAIYVFAKKHNLRVIEDAAHSFGGTYNGKKIGSFGDVVCFSFDGIKNLTCGEGGAVVTHDPIVAERVKDARLLGVQKDTEKRFNKQRSWEFDVVDQGWRYHMSDINAAIGRAQLQRFDVMKANRRKIAKTYYEAFKNHQHVRLLDLPYETIVSHIFCIMVDKNQRQGLKECLMENGVETGLHYKPNHLLTRYQTDYPLPHAEKIYEEIITIPCHSVMTAVDAENVCNLIKAYFA